MRSRYILAIDSCGIRGIIPSMFLAEIERRTNRPISNIFHLIAALSTGAITACGLCKADCYNEPEFFADDFVKFYEENRKYLIDRRPALLKWIGKSGHVDRNFNQILHNNFGETVLGESLTNLLIAGIDNESGNPAIFTSWGKNCAHLKMKDVLKSAAKPSTKFIKSNALELNGEHIGEMFDGEVIENNSQFDVDNNTDNVINIGFCHFGDKKHEKVHLLSLSTGKRTFISWWRSLIYNLYNRNVSYRNRTPILMVEKYLKIERELPKALKKMTDASIMGLKWEAEELISINSDGIDEICEELVCASIK